MTLKLIVSLEAHADIVEAVTWLRDVSPSLPPRFGKELESVYASILEHPQMYPNVHQSFRRALLHTFLMQLRNAVAHGFEPRTAAPSISDVVPDIRRLQHAA